MNERWWCLDCRTTVELSIHGRCSTCGSNSVDSMERLGLWVSANILPTMPPALARQYARAI
jgi:Zn finger protein HypA/HybF involved in hydrogenase expression